VIRAARLPAQAAALLLACLILLWLPHRLSDFHTSQVAYVAIYAIALLGLNILTGYTGQISLGHGAFMAIGGYVTAALVLHHGTKDLWTIPIAALAAGLVGLLFGIPALRLSGPYLALATFAVAVAIPQVIKKLDDVKVHTHALGVTGKTGLTGGSQGLQLFGSPDLTGAVAGVNVLGHHLTPFEWLYYLSWAIALVLFVAAWLLTASRFGLSTRAIRDSEVAAASSGVNPAFYKTLAFGISAFYAGVAGALYAMANTFVNPAAYPVTLSITLLIGLAVGGLGWLPGAVAGAAFIQYMPNLAQQVTKRPGAPAVVYGVVLIAVMLVLPTGFGGLVRQCWSLTTRLLRRSHSGTGPGAADAKGVVR
jgi:branched-chain amino acid transport system permease protein